MNKNTLIKVKNRDNGTVGYTIPDLGIRRTFAAGETKEITFEELQKLHYISGGDFIIENCLLINNKDAIKEIFQERTVEPEYFYTEDDIKDLLLNQSLDALLDCLDFAPKGVIDLVKDMAVKLEINDIAKRDAIFKKTGFNVNKAVEINKETSAPDATEKTAKRRVAIPVSEEVNKEEAPQRRVPTNKYSVKE